MEYFLIRFLEWRDRPAQTEGAAQKELAALADQIGTLKGQMVRVTERIEQRSSGDTSTLSARAQAMQQEIDALEDKRDEIMNAETWRARDAAKAALAHRRVGTLGYQVVSDAMEVVREVDERGDDLPAGATYASEVVDANPPRPAWADAKEAAWAAAEVPVRV